MANRRTWSSARSLIVGTVAVVCLGDVAVPASGREGAPVAGVLIERIGASGSIEQDPSGVLKGSFLGPFPSGFDDYFVNGVAGWWEHPCHDGAACGPADGSPVFQGSLAGGVWEFYDDPGGDYRFRVASFFAVACADPLTCP